MNRCGAKTRSGGECKKGAGAGTDHPGFGNCKHHGGSTPNGKRFGHRLMVEQELDALGVPIETTGEEALLYALAQAYGSTEYLRQRILEESQNDDGVHLTSVLAASYGEWLDRLARLSSLAVRADLSGRLVKIREREAALMEQLIIAVLSDAEWGLTREQQALGRRVIGRHLQAV